jgi:hypothetical protein
MLFLPKSLNKLALACGDSTANGSRYIHVLEFAGSYRLEATDGYRLLVAQGLPGDWDSRHEFWSKVVAKLAEKPLGVFEAFILVNDWTKAFRVLTGKGEGIGLSLGVNDEGVLVATFASDEATMEVRCEATGSVRFPNVDAVLPKSGPLSVIAVDGRLFAEMIAGMADMTVDPKDNPQRKVRIAAYPQAQKGIGLLASNSELVLNGLIMPLVPEAGDIPVRVAKAGPDDEEEVDEDDDEDDDQEDEDLKDLEEQEAAVPEVVPEQVPEQSV